MSSSRRSVRFSVDMLSACALIDCGYALPATGYVHSIRSFDDISPFVSPECSDSPVYNIITPLSILLCRLPRQYLLDIAVAHSIPISHSERTVDAIVTALRAHVCCSPCDRLPSVFTGHEAKQSRMLGLGWTVMLDSCWCEAIVPTCHV